MADGKWKRRDRNKALNEEALGYKQIILTGHAQDQMKIRGITEQDVIHVLRFPTRTTGLPTQPKRHRYRWNKTVRTAIDVVWQDIGGHLCIITTIKVARRISGR